MKKLIKKMESMRDKLTRINKWVNRILMVEYYKEDEKGDKLCDIKDLLIEQEVEKK